MADKYQFTDVRSSLSGDGSDDKEKSTADVGVDKETLSSALQLVGANIWENLDDTARQNIGFNRANITFVKQLGSIKHSSTRTTTINGVKSEVPCYKVIGMKFHTNVDIKVPNIPYVDIMGNADLKYMAPWSEVEGNSVLVKAGSDFVLTRVEALWFFVMSEFGLQGFCSYNNNPMGVRISFKITKEIVVANGYVTPCWFNGTKKANGVDESLKVGMELVDEQRADGSRVIKPEYAEKFAALYPTKQDAPDKNAETAEKGVLAIEYCLKEGGYTGIRSKAATLAASKKNKRR